MGGLEYKKEDRFSPIPPWERELQTVEAELFATVETSGNVPVEGLCFDREGNLYICKCLQGIVLRMDMNTKEFTEVFRDPDLIPTAVKIHRDGRLFVCCIGHKKTGRIFSINPDGSDMQVISAGEDVDDLVFDSEGGIYFTKFVGTAIQKTGGIGYIPPDFSSSTMLFENLATPNGVALTLDESFLWVTEFGDNRLHRLALKKGLRSSVSYHFTGFKGPDSCSIDEEDNLYVACVAQGRVLVFNYYGNPIGQVLIPGREEGRFLASSHPMVRPGTKELYICASDDFGGGAAIFKAGAFAKGNGKAFQFT